MRPVVVHQRMTISVTIQHAMSPEFCEKWGTEEYSCERDILTLGFRVPSTYPALCGIHLRK